MIAAAFRLGRAKPTALRLQRSIFLKGKNATFSGYSKIYTGVKSNLGEQNLIYNIKMDDKEIHNKICTYRNKFLGGADLKIHDEKELTDMICYSLLKLLKEAESCKLDEIHDLGFLMNIAADNDVSLDIDVYKLCISAVEKFMKMQNLSGMHIAITLLSYFTIAYGMNQFEFLFNIAANILLPCFLDHQKRDIFSNLIEKIPSNALLNVSSKISYPLSCDQCLEYIALVDKHVKNTPIISYLNSFIKLLSWQESYEEGLKLLDVMCNHKDNRYSPNEDTLNEVLMQLQTRRMGRESLNVLEIGERLESESRLIFDPIYCTLVAYSFISEERQIINIKKLFSQSKDDIQDCKRSIFYHNMLKIITYSKDYKSIKKAYLKLREARYKIDNVTVDNVAIRADEFKDSSFAMKILDDYLSRNYFLHYYTISTLIRCLVHDPKKLGYYFYKLSSSNKINNFNTLVSYMQTIFLAADKLDNAVELALEAVSWAHKNNLLSTHMINYLFRIYYVKGLYGEIINSFNKYFASNFLILNANTLSIIAHISDNMYTGNDKFLEFQKPFSELNEQSRTILLQKLGSPITTNELPSADNTVQSDVTSTSTHL